MLGGFKSEENLMSLEKTEQLLKSWGLSQHAIFILSQEPEIVADLAKARELEPFAVDFKPRVFEVLFEDVVYIRWQEGKKPFIADCSENYQPLFTEYALDEQCALFLINGEVVVNRAENIHLNVTDFLQEVANARWSS